MESGWLKYFTDGSRETGTDTEVDARKASWRNGKLDGLVAVDLCMNNRLVSLKAGEGNWWQADSYIAKLTPGTKTKGELVARRVMRQLTEQDMGKFVFQTTNDNHITIEIGDKLPLANPGEAIKLAHPHAGKWLIVEITKNQIEISIENEKR